MIVPTRRVTSLLAAVALLGGRAAAEEPPTPAQIAAWVEALGSVQYSQREAATKSLIAAGIAALPPLREAIRAGDLEVSSRAIEIARAMLGADDEPATAAAEAFLQAIADGGEPAVARQAADTLDFHALGMAAAAREKLESLGAIIRNGALLTGQPGMHVTLDANWQGTPADMQLLARVPGLMMLSVHGVTIDAAALPALGRLRHTARIELYGTGLSDGQIATLAEKLPDTDLEVRKGGKLGVGGQPNPGPCLITQVQPGSAADKAGVQVGDIVLTVDGEPVANFKALTDRVGTRGPGEKVALEILRGPPGEAAERLTRTIELDAW